MNKKQTRDFNYKNTTSKYGDFSARITDKKLEIILVKKMKTKRIFLMKI